MPQPPGRSTTRTGRAWSDITGRRASWTAGQTSARGCPDAPGGLGEVGGPEPSPTEARLHLQLDPQCRSQPGGGGGRERGVQELEGAGAHRDSAPGSPGPPGCGNRVEDEDRAPDPGLAEGHGLVERGDAEAVGTGGLEGPGDGARPVAVGISPDDRMDGNARTGLPADGGGGGP